MNITRNSAEIQKLFDSTQNALSGSENLFPERTYAQGIMDTLTWLLGWESSPFEKEEE